MSTLNPEQLPISKPLESKYSLDEVIQMTSNVKFYNDMYKGIDGGDLFYIEMILSLANEIKKLKDDNISSKKRD